MTDAGDTIGQRSQETDEEHLDVLAPGRHDLQNDAASRRAASSNVPGSSTLNDRRMRSVAVSENAPPGT